MSQQSTGLSRDEKRRRRLTPPATAPPTDDLSQWEAPPERLVSKGELLERTGLSFPTIWQMMRRGEFPLARVVGGKSMWLSSDVDAWIKSLPLRKYKPPQSR